MNNAYTDHEVQFRFHVFIHGRHCSSEGKTCKLPHETKNFDNKKNIKLILVSSKMRKSTQPRPGHYRNGFRSSPGFFRPLFTWLTPVLTLSRFRTCDNAVYIREARRSISPLPFPGSTMAPPPLDFN